MEAFFNRVLTLKRCGMPYAKIARLYGISRNSLFKLRRRYGLDEPNMSICDAELQSLLTSLSTHYPTWGSVTLRGALLSMGIQASENRIRRILKIVDPVGVEERRRRSLIRREYSVPAPNYLWHIDGHHKLIMWGFVIHGCIDGFSRKVIFLECSTNNTASTVFEAFQDGIQRSGIPERVRGDHGCENGDVASFMRDLYDDDSRFIHGTSVHNQRIERHWRDAFEKVVGTFKDLFLYLENNSLLDENSVIDLFCLQYVFIGRIQLSLDRFVESWNYHPLSTERGQAPNLLWTANMDVEYNLSSIKEERTVNSMINKIADSSFISNVSHEILNLWFQSAAEILPDPLFEDGNLGIDNYVRLRNHLMNQ